MLVQKSSLVKCISSLATFILIATIILIPSRISVQSQGSFTPTPTSPPVPQLIESDSQYVQRFGNWTSQQAAAASEGSYLYSSGNTEDALGFAFEGSSVTIVYVEGPSLGTLAIEIDDTVVRTVITTSSNTNYSVQAVVDYLEPGVHTIEVYPVDGIIAVDAFTAIFFSALPDLSLLPPPDEGGIHSPNEIAVVFDPDSAPSSGCRADTSSSELISNYVEVGTVADFYDAIDAANARPVEELNVPYSICLTAATYLLQHTVNITSRMRIYSATDAVLGGEVIKPRLARPTTGFIGTSLFNIETSGFVEFSHVTISGGYNPEGYGGGIINAGTLLMYDSVLTLNSAIGGGAILNNGGRLYVTRTTFEDNAAASIPRDQSAGGAILNNTNGIVEAYCSRFDDNYSEHTGAAIFNRSNGRVGTPPVVVQYSRFVDNHIYIFYWGPDDIVNTGATVEAQHNYWRHGTIENWADVTPVTVVTSPMSTIGGTDPSDPTNLLDPGFNDDCTPLGRPIRPDSPCNFRVIINDATEPYPGTTQMATDMRAFAFANGLYIHAAPVINSPKVEVTVRDIEGTPTNPASFIPWGYAGRIEAVYRIAFSDDEQHIQQIWYGLPFSYQFDNDGDPNTAQIVDHVVWVLVQLNNPNDPQNPYLYARWDDGDPNTLDTVEPELCSELEAPSTITFPYDRNTAAAYATAHAYQNDAGDSDGVESPTDAPGQGRVTTRLQPSIPYLDSQEWPLIWPSLNNIPFADFYYDGNLQHGETGFTGSAIFMSEAIWMGGMPMTLDQGGSSQTCSLNNNTTAGWAVCGLSYSNVWGLHQPLISYFTDASAPHPDAFSTANNVIGTNIISESTEFPSQFPPSDDCLTSVNPLDCIEFIYWQNLEPFVDLESGGIRLIDQAGLHDYLTQAESLANLQYIKEGDYMWTDSRLEYQNKPAEGAYHGYMVVGWGPVRTCAEVMDLPRIRDNRLLPIDQTYLESHPLATVDINYEFSLDEIAPTYDAALDLNDHIVPYVVDFPGERYYGRRTQLPTPRPFYCTRYFQLGFYQQTTWGLGYQQYADIQTKLAINYNGNFAVDNQSTFTVVEEEVPFQALGRHNWWFYTLPESVEISPTSLYTETKWQTQN